MKSPEAAQSRYTYEPLVVVVEPDDEIRNMMTTCLTGAGFRVIGETNPTAALEHMRAGHVDGYVVDMAMPGIDGIAFVQTVNTAQPDAVVVIFTFQDDEETHLRAIEFGADDFLSRSTTPTIAIERLRNCINRVRRWSLRRSTLELGSVEVDFQKLEMRSNGVVVPTTTKELYILRLLAEHQGAPVRREVILSQVWKYDVLPTTRTVDNFIMALRRKIEADPSRPTYIQTVPGIGYKFIMPESNTEQQPSQAQAANS